MLTEHMLAKCLRDRVCKCVRTRVSVSISVLLAVILEEKKGSIGPGERKRKQKRNWFNQRGWESHGVVPLLRRVFRTIFLRQTCTTLVERVKFK